ncbi:endo-1,4-beta-xylanase [Bacteroidota bacterium]
MRIRKLTLLFILIVVLVPLDAQKSDSAYIPWKLDGANERIEMYRKGDRSLQFVLPDGSTLATQAPVQFSLEKHAFNFGISLVQSWGIYKLPDFEKYRQYMGEVFNYVTLGFFWSWIEKTEGELIENEHTISNLEWAKRKHMTIKGVPLLWHQSLPGWLIDIQDQERVEQLIHEHISYLLNHYPDVAHWGVYNEAIAANKSHVTPNSVTRWVDYKGGPEPAVASLLSLTHQINPDKVYINNHYAYSDKEFKDLNQYLVSSGADFDVIGIQAHMHAIPDRIDEEQLWGSLEEYARFNKPIHLTEVSVISSESYADWQEVQEYDKRILNAWLQKKIAPYRESKPDLECYQAAYLKDFYTLAFSHPSVETIVYWSGTDLNEWRGSAGGLLDRDYNPKPAYLTLKKLIKEEWNTIISDHTGKDGKVTFRGFYGDYKGTIYIEDKEYMFSFTHSAIDNTDLHVNVEPK